MGGGHKVVIEALRTYSGKLGQDVQIPTEVGRLVQQSDVGDESWGVVGLFVKNEYTEMLTDLQDLVIEMGSGLTAAAEKLGNAATAYEQNEDDNVKALNEILKLLDQPAQSRTPQMGPAK
ncbi:hypothetical protein AB0N89_14360 [Amycolatopsis sp. NPDC089917]|uniref:hypothetical protein n=1 Tax=Amycolatopsis sp. NPDC089917 TaxID=3155187 RepID=UPI0034469C5F